MSVKKSRFDREREEGSTRLTLISNIVDNNDTMGTSVVRRCNGTEPLLSSSIPLGIEETLRVKEGREGESGDWN